MLRSFAQRTSAAVVLTQNEMKSIGAERTLRTIVERATAAVTLRPAVGRDTDTTTVSLRDGTACLVEEGSWQVRADLDPELGGSHDHPGPGFLLRAALGACFAQTTMLWAARFGVPINHLDVEVDATHDARGLLGVDGTPSRFTGLTCRMTVQSPAPEENVRRVVDAARDHSPVQGSLQQALPIECDVRIREPSAE